MGGAVLLAATALAAGSQAMAYAAETPTCFGQKATIVGSSGSNRIHGTSGKDVIVAGGGNDKVFAGTGDDLVCGGWGADRLHGGGGRDWIAQHGSGSWGVHRSNLAILGPIQDPADMLDLVATNKLACWGVLTIGTGADVYVIPGGYREL